MNTQNVFITLMAAILLLMCGCASSREAPRIRLAWKDNMLTVLDARLPGGHVDIWYLEAYCRSGSTDRDWKDTVIPHSTKKTSSDGDAHCIELLTHVEPDVTVHHEIEAGSDEVSFRMRLTNHGRRFIDLDWVQPCIRVGAFTGLVQEDYFTRCFIFTEDGLTFLHETHRATEARYTPGQVYVPNGIDLEDVNPRPISQTQPVNGLIGCVSADGALLLAMAWDHTQELFQGVITCIHSDPHIGGLGPGETVTRFGKLYLLPHDPQALLSRYHRDFPEAQPFAVRNPQRAR